MANAISEAFKSVKAFLLRKFMMNISLAAVQEVSGNMDKATDSKSVKADLEISYDEENPNVRASPPRSRSGKRLMAKARSV